MPYLPTWRAATVCEALKYQKMKKHDGQTKILNKES